MFCHYQLELAAKRLTAVHRAMSTLALAVAVAAAVANERGCMLVSRLIDTFSLLWRNWSRRLLRLSC